MYPQMVYKGSENGPSPTTSRVIIVIQIVLLIFAVRVITTQANALGKLAASREAALDTVGDLMIRSTECQSDRLRLQASLQTCSSVVEPAASRAESVLEQAGRSASSIPAAGQRNTMVPRAAG